VDGQQPEAHGHKPGYGRVLLQQAGRAEQQEVAEQGQKQRDRHVGEQRLAELRRAAARAARVEKGTLREEACARPPQTAGGAQQPYALVLDA
jgi:hypothetical protein